jgi:hypothetical protein
MKTIGLIESEAMFWALPPLPRFARRVLPVKPICGRPRDALTPALSRNAGEGDGTPSCEKRAAAAGLSPKPQADLAHV